MTIPLRVLIVEDNPDDAELALIELRRAGYDPDWTRVETESAFLAAIATSPDIILSDYSMPCFSGLRAADLLRKSGLGIPFILVSGTVGEEVAVEAMRLGATDYLLKDRMGRLGSAVERALREAQTQREREQTQIAIQVMQAQLQKTLELSPVVVYSVKIDGTRVSSHMVHENITRLLGFTVEETANFEWWSEHLHPDDRAGQLSNMTSESDGGATEYRFRHKDGHYLHVEDHRRILRDSDGTPIEVSGVWIDITNRKIAELELADLHRKQALIFDSMDEGIHGIDLDGHSTFENPAATRMFGWTVDEMRGRPAHDFVHHSHADGTPFPIALCGITATLRDGISRRVDDEVFWRKDGSSFPVEYVVAPQLDEHGAIAGAVVVFHDIAERRNLEAQFRQSQKLESIGQLAGGIAHDFNNILAVMMLQAELAASVDDTPVEVLDGLMNIRGAAQRAADLTRQLLLFSRKQVMQPQALELNGAVVALVRMLGRIVPEHVDLQLHLHATPLWTYADAAMLDQVLLNLAVNASDAMPSGGELIIETMEHRYDSATDAQNVDAYPGRFIGLRVRDTGTGISHEARAHIFEPFFTTKAAGKGTGLGLATVFGVVKQHRGWIDVQSDVGVGTTVAVYLPAVEPRLHTPEHNASAASKRPDTLITVLLAEDDGALRDLAAIVLERHGFRVLTAANGVDAHALWMASKGEVGLLLTDIVMPGGVDGRELASILQAEAPELKVLFTSGYSAAIAGKELKLQRGQHFIQKPWSTEQLLDAVSGALAE